ncbi:MAG: alpha/beta hydrolase-fold protein [Actinomycetota bacterium]|nr:alpha/beta hydrolase-fold protein [Actinomycetota bacterium]
MIREPHPPIATDPSTPIGGRVSRRSVLVGGLGAAMIGGLSACADDEQAEIDPPRLGVHAADDELPPEESPPQIPSDGPALITGTFRSAKMGGRDTRWAVARPDGVSGQLPVVLVLHALNTNEQSIFSEKQQMQNVLQRYVDDGGVPFALASADVGRNYYHRRTDGADGAAMILDEFLPMLGADPQLNLSTERIGLFGWSMGGYGALRLGAMVGSPKVAAVSVSSPALWADPRNFPPRAFDSAADYRAHSLFGQQSAFRSIPLLICIGSSDQFFTYTRQWAADLHPPAAFGTSAGGHTNRYWRGVLPDHVEFLGRNLAR